jgi:hypothetical protein
VAESVVAGTRDRREAQIKRKREKWRLGVGK